MSLRKDGKKLRLPQKEREAIIDLLHLCLYADSHLTLKEGEFIADAVDRMGWETLNSFSSYEVKSIANARAAKESPATKEEFLSFAAERLHSKDSRMLAMELCEQLLSSDGPTAEAETALLGEIHATLEGSLVTRA